MTVEQNTLSHGDALPAGINEPPVNQNSASGLSAIVQSEQLWVVDEDNIADLLAKHFGPVIVDLDETLYLRNSTEEFVGLAAPGILAAYLLRFLDLASPWRFIGGPKCRDNWRILLILILFPWTYLRWKKHCQTTATKFINITLRDALQNHTGHTIIASNGYQILIRPLLNEFKLANTELVCCQLFRPGDRRYGKLALLKKTVAPDIIAQSLVVTDSHTDADLLQVCKIPCLTVWRDALFVRAFDGIVYLPTDYLGRVKRPKQRANRTLFIYDIVPWVLVGLSTSLSITEALGLIVLFLSMWSIYEIGYFDNDQCAINYEKDPKLTAEAAAFNGRYFKTKAWLTALVLGAIAIALINPEAFLQLYEIWIVTLLALHGAYWIYNRIDKMSRVWIYPVLQLFRFGAVFAVAPIAPVAFAVVFSQVFCRWINYIIYRQQRTADKSIKWPKTADQTIRLVTCFMLLLPLLIAGDWQAFVTPASICLIIFAYGFWKYDWHSARTSFHRLDKKMQ